MSDRTAIVLMVLATLAVLAFAAFAWWFIISNTWNH